MPRVSRYAIAILLISKRRRRAYRQPYPFGPIWLRTYYFSALLPR